MAHSPEKKAEAVADIFSGMTWAAASEKHKVSQATLKDWIDKAKTEAKPKRTTNESEVSRSPVEGRNQRFNTALRGFLMATIQMLDAWAIGCADPEFFKENPSGANELGCTVLDRADKLVHLLDEPETGDEA